MESLSESEIKVYLKGPLTSWEWSGDKLHRKLEFRDFRQAMSFMVEVGFSAEEQGHHPDLRNTFNKVNISLATHDVGGKVTEKDVRLAKAIEEIYSNY
ncbi:MAG: 4a-hydroxytetrahydrobiopterin dehydratase [Balneolaceae bacterium]